jgi:hypothetical protein
MLCGREAHQEHDELDGEVNGGLCRRNSWLRPSERGGRWQRYGSPRLDSFSTKTLSSMAVTTVVMAKLGEVPTGGDGRSPAQLGFRYGEK